MVSLSIVFWRRHRGKERLEDSPDRNSALLPNTELEAGNRSIARSTPEMDASGQQIFEAGSKHERIVGDHRIFEISG